MPLDSRCQLCGTSVRSGLVLLDQKFWLKSATGEEIEHFSERCAWCAVLKEIYFKCLTEKERLAQGVLDWGSHFEPVWRANGGNINVELEIFATGETHAALDGIPIKSILPKSTSSTASFTQTLRWIKYCDALHTKCSTQPDHDLPKRLLDIGMNKSRFAQRVKLVETTGMESPYVCLSHCWGSGQSIPVTKKSNYADQLGGIAWETLPQTFQDAVVFARKLQIRYMWIDSLCIVQDDRSDWAENTANMASVYQNGYLTLAATSAEDSRGGLFYAGHSSTYGTYKHSLQRSDRILVEGEVAFRRKLPHFSDMESGHSTQRNKSAAGFPLLKRAWIYQERLLSPRILHFTHHELLWECLEGSICQCLLGSEPFSPSDSPVSPSRSPSSPGRINHLPQDCSIGLDGSDEASRLIAWHNILVKYSKLTITYHTDRLSALSGIAQQFGRPYASQYLAGMWKEQICYDLIWISLDAGSSPRPLNWSVPSWSWASIEGAVRFPWTTSGSFHTISDYPYRAAFTIPLASSAVPLSRDPCGQLASAVLQLSGPVVEATIRYSRTKIPEYGIHIKDGLVHRFHADYALHEPNSEDYVASGEKVKCLRMWQWYPQEHVLSLVLKQVEPDIAVFKRVGLVEEICTREDIKAMRDVHLAKGQMNGSAIKHSRAEIVTII